MKTFKKKDEKKTLSRHQLKFEVDKPTDPLDKKMDKLMRHLRITNHYHGFFNTKKRVRASSGMAVEPDLAKDINEVESEPMY